MLQALIFDVDGTIADTESLHLRAFNLAFAECEIAANWSEAQYTELLEISGGKERLQHYFTQNDIYLNPDEIARIHQVKNEIYSKLMTSKAIGFRPGIGELFEEARANGKKLAIATTTSPENLNALLSAKLGSNWRTYFAVINDASTVTNKKPSPDAYLKTLGELGIGHTECVAFEDSHNGLIAALGASLTTIVTPTAFTKHHDFTGATLVLPSLKSRDQISPRVNLQLLERFLK